MELEGMVPAGVRALMEELRRAESSLSSAGAELWGLLRAAGLPPTHAETVRRLGSWAGRQVTDVNRRLLLLERLVEHDPQRFREGEQVFVNSEVFAPGTPVPTGSPDDPGQAAASVSGLAGTLWKFAPARRLADPDGWRRESGDTAEGLVYGVRQPVGFAHDAPDWATWAAAPGRAVGRLAPEALMAAAAGHDEADPEARPSGLPSEGGPG
ncbi:hypothetical protein [Spongiactinospora gelatinilytica]|nr:hypothetical protein [Spongiactinospora gelatinilytica]